MYGRLGWIGLAIYAAGIWMLSGRIGFALVFIGAALIIVGIAHWIFEDKDD
jgi:hypothetical protein